jgi:tetratricopeptide (TPR) repeat protein
LPAAAADEATRTAAARQEYYAVNRSTRDRRPFATLSPMLSTHTLRHLLHRIAGSSVLGAALLVAAACDTNSEFGALQRGDVLFATDSLEQALAEYRLAVVQGGNDPALLARVAHTYVELRRVDPAVEFYQLAAAADPSWADQGAVDLMRLAELADQSGDRFLMATAVSRALELKPGLGLGDMALPLARHFFRNGEYGPALPLYQRALVRNDTTSEILFEVGQVHEEIGDCQQALYFFERFRELAPRREQSRSDWHIGTCAFALARDLRSQAVQGTSEPDARALPDPVLLEEALTHVDRTIELGEPRNIQGSAWFERGEILAALGDCAGSLAAFERVRTVEASASSATASRALERIDLLRFGRGLDRLRPSGACY